MPTSRVAENSKSLGVTSVPGQSSWEPIVVNPLRARLRPIAIATCRIYEHQWEFGQRFQAIGDFNECWCSRHDHSKNCRAIAASAPDFRNAPGKSQELFSEAILAAPKMDKYLRSWRQEALNKGQHDAAIYVGDKVLALTSMVWKLRVLPRLTVPRRRLGCVLACSGPFLQQQLHTSTRPSS
jgi:hypothetical protein